MEVEAFPIGFTKGIRSHWRRRKYQRLEAGDGGSRTKGTQRLGGGARRSGGWRLRLRGLILRRVRVVRAVVAAPARLLGWLRDAYVGGMLTVARKAAITALPSEGVWTKRVPRRKHQKLLLPGAAAAAQEGPSEFEKRLVMEIYKSIVASKELTTMLHSSAAHLTTNTASA
ncbi:uncharacterized protein LOC124648266 [Lolium rigidum]|uniref:uncharacterized protein LOC124648266 n=1 Tax=Lolium rigidum TaxID=89674 RepID=UPI001F5C3FD5|nr:uncharacterized protein LOC124648266 [Lolium rigidum]